jgi:hypothetical protein
MKPCSVHLGILEEEDLPEKVDLERFGKILDQVHDYTVRNKYSEPDYCGLEIKEKEGAIYFEADEMTNNIKNYIETRTEELVEEVEEAVIFNERLGIEERYTLQKKI